MTKPDQYPHSAGDSRNVYPSPRSQNAGASPSRPRGLLLRLGLLLFFPSLVLANTVATTESAPLPIPAASLHSNSASRSTPRLVSTQISAENFATHHVGGPDADAGIGDWFLSNGSICAAFSAPSHESPLTPEGGVLIDLGHCGKQDDQWTLLQPMLNLDQNQLLRVSAMDAGGDGESAWIETRAELHGVEIKTTYTMRSDRPFEVEVSTRSRRTTEGDRLFALGFILLHPSGQTPVFSLQRSDFEESLGFAYPESDRRSIRSLLSAISATDLTILVGADGMPPISYGLERVTSSLIDAGHRSPLTSFNVTGEHFTAVNALSRTLWTGHDEGVPSILQFAQIPFMDLGADMVLENQYRIHVGARADVAAVTDGFWREETQVTGQIDAPDARIHIDRRSGTPMTEIRPESDGRFALNLPAGEYTARMYAPGGREAQTHFDVPENVQATEIPPLSLPKPAWVDLPESFIGRLIFISQATGKSLIFGSNLLGHRIGSTPVLGGLEAPYISLAGSPADPERVAVAPGRYRVVAVRGPEYAAHEMNFEATAGKTTMLSVAPLPRVRPTPGWIAADFHVHSGESFDSSVPQDRQVAAFAASGAEVLIATEHDRVFDPTPSILRSGLTDQLVSVTGVEVTSAYEGGDSPNASGHFNVFPFVPTEDAFRRGAPALEGRRIRDAFADIRDDPNQKSAFIQLNHPRPGPDEKEGDTYFGHLGVAGASFEPTRSLTESPNQVLIEKSPKHGGRDLDYDGVELMNGESLLRYRRTRADWFNLMLQGEVILGTANSDSHLLSVPVGIPRTYVAMPEDRISAFSEEGLMTSLRAGTAWGSTGPLITVSLGGTPIGGLHPLGGAQTAELTLEVQAAPWVPVSEWRVYVNAEPVHQASIEAGESAALPLVFTADSFVTVEVEGPATGLYADALPGFKPFAFTNPIFVDFDGNGVFDAPGLPSDLPPTLTAPDSPH